MSYIEFKNILFSSILLKCWSHVYSDSYLPITNIQASVVSKNTDEKVFTDVLSRWLFDQEPVFIWHENYKQKVSVYISIRTVLLLLCFLGFRLVMSFGTTIRLTQIFYHNLLLVCFNSIIWFTWHHKMQGFYLRFKLDFHEIIAKKQNQYYRQPEVQLHPSQSSNIC